MEGANDDGVAAIIGADKETPLIGLHDVVISNIDKESDATVTVSTGITSTAHRIVEDSVRGSSNSISPVAAKVIVNDVSNHPSPIELAADEIGDMDNAVPDSSSVVELTTTRTAAMDEKKEEEKEEEGIAQEDEIDTDDYQIAICDANNMVEPAPNTVIQQQQPLWRQDDTSASNTSLKLLSLPIDSLHCIASFLTAADWAKFGQTTTIAAPICRNVFTRVRMHGFRCATEVVTAWKLGQHADARELSALYIQAGVPVYPLSLGHAYHTLVWRMGVEARDMERGTAEQEANNDEPQLHENNNDASTESERRPIDLFFAERYEARLQRQGDDHLLNSSYLEEKCLYCYNKAAEKDSRLGARVSMTSRSNFAPPAPVLGPGGGGGMRGAASAWDGRTRLPDFRPAAASDASPQQHARKSPTAGSGTSTLAYSDASRIPPKVHVKLHRHLVDQHVLGGVAVDDENGGMVASPISLSADFFHQNVRNIFDTNNYNFDERQETPEPPIAMFRAQLRPPPGFQMNSSSGTSSCFSLGARLEDRGAEIAYGHETMVPVGEASMFVDSQLSGHDPLAPPDLSSVSSGDHGLHTPTPSYETPLQQQYLLSASLLASPPPPPPVLTRDELSFNAFSLHSEPSVLSGIDLEVYNSASANIPSLSDHCDGRSELKSHLKTRFAVVQRQLEALLSQNDSSGFEEYLLDFWDEFLPVTANIHFHDRNTAVPRISGLQKFLSKPCPQALGIVQCEIERIKVNSKRKGVNMKGRLFPSYEYRLFIRDGRHDSAAAESATVFERPARRDTVLMMAKNRGRKHQEAAGVLPAPGASKKGVNNYYLYKPQQVDVDTHYRSVNSNSDSALSTTNGVSGELPPRAANNDSSVLLGRLQSNFIGTEFQIFTPTVQKHPVVGRKPPVSTSRHPASSDSESDYEGASSDNAPTSPRRRNRFHRRRSNPVLMRRGNREHASERHQPEPISEEESADGSASTDRRRSKRAYSLPNFSYRRSTRSSRRAVANSVDPPDASQHYQTQLYEEEDGAITYTANLLGNRPRIMDVCVPKVSTEGIPAAEWIRYLGSVDDSSEATVNSMLNHFRQLQQRLENPDQNNATAVDSNNTDGNNENEEGGEPSYVPPDDFGLQALQNRPPWWNVELGAFVLNFGGRVSVASVKNFQLCDRNDQDHIMLQFGRIQGRHSFTMDFQHPLTAVQAFAIAISSLQSRISFG